MDPVHGQVGRRGFLAAAAAAAFTARGSSAGALSETPTADDDPRVAALAAESPGVDTHNHIDVPLLAGDVPGPDLDIAGELRKSGLAAVCATFAVDYQKLDRPGMAYDRFVSGMKAMDAQLARTKVRRVLTPGDLRDAHKRREPAVIQAVEGGHFVEGKVERVEEAYKLGLRVLGLIHDNDATPPLGDIYTMPARFGGLTKLGAEVVKECNRLGVVVDLTHASAETVAMALRVSTKPAIFSHTGLDSRLGNNPNLARMMKPRLISREHARDIGQAGGVVGVWTKMTETPAEYVQALRAMVDAAGIDHVCIGTDSKLTPGANPGGKFDGGGPGGGKGGPPGGGFGGPPGNGKGGAGGPGQKSRSGERTNESWAGQKAGFYYAVVGEMLRQGFDPAEIGKVGSGNFCRVFDACTSGRP